MTRRWTAVVGVDGSRAARDGLVWAIHEAARRDGIVHAIHVWQRAQCATPGPPAYPHEAREAAEALLLDVVESVPGRRGARIYTQAIEGDPAAVLVRISSDADVLIVGRASRRPTSIYQRCVRLAPRRVSVVVAAGHQTSRPERRMTRTRPLRAAV